MCLVSHFTSGVVDDESDVILSSDGVRRRDGRKECRLHKSSCLRGAEYYLDVGSLGWYSTFTVQFLHDLYGLGGCSIDPDRMECVESCVIGCHPVLRDCVSDKI